MCIFWRKHGICVDISNFGFYCMAVVRWVVWCTETTHKGQRRRIRPNSLNAWPVNYFPEGSAGCHKPPWSAASIPRAAACQIGDGSWATRLGRGSRPKEKEVGLARARKEERESFPIFFLFKPFSKILNRFWILNKTSQHNKPMQQMNA